MSSSHISRAMSPAWTSLTDREEQAQRASSSPSSPLSPQTHPPIKDELRPRSQGLAADLRASVSTGITKATGSKVEKGTELRPEDVQAIQSLGEQLVAQLLINGPSETPDAQAWGHVLAIESMVNGLNPTQLPRAAELLQDNIKAAVVTKASAAADQDLLLDLVAAMTTPQRPNGSACLTDKLRTGLCLDKVKWVEDFEEEPNSRTFNSVLPDIAALIYEHGLLGRTLLWEGACGLFSGSRQPQRRNTLKELIFKFPQPPATGQGKLEGYDFCMIVHDMELDEIVDLKALKSQYDDVSRPADGAHQYR